MYVGIGQSKTTLSSSWIHSKLNLFVVLIKIHILIQVLPEQVVLAQTPMRTLTEYHNKHVLISGQGATEEIARTYVWLLSEKEIELMYFFLIRIGFKNITTIEKVCAAFPELDMVNHMNRVRLVSIGRRRKVWINRLYDRSFLLERNDQNGRSCPRWKFSSDRW